MDKEPSDWKSVRIPKGIDDLVSEYLRSETAKTRGLTSKSDVATYAIRRLLETDGMYQKQDRFRHFNMYEDNVKIVDNFIDRIATIYFRNGKAFCDICHTEECAHVDYALSIPAVVKILAEHNFPSIRKSARKWLKEG